MSETIFPNDVVLASTFLETPKYCFSGCCFVDNDIVIGERGFLEYICINGYDKNKFTEGGFSLISNKNNVINAFNDIMGQDILFYYEHKNIWAISNSFYALINHLSEHKAKLTFYTPGILYTKISHSTGEQPLSFNTMVAEIKILPMDKEIYITNNSVKIEAKHLGESSQLPYDSLLEEFFKKWFGRAQTLINGVTNNVSVDISGGVDSRGVLSTLVNNTDLKHVNFNSNAKWKDDFVVAEAISKILGFELNSNAKQNNRIRLSDFECYETWKYSSLGVYTKIYTAFHNTSINRFQYHGAGGEVLRSHMHGTANQYLKNIKKYFIEDNQYKLICLELTSFFKESDMDMDCHKSMPFHYIHNRQRFHFGRRWYKNRTAVLITPLLCPLLNKAFELLTVQDQKDNKLMFDLISRSNKLLACLPFDKPEKSFPARFWREFDESKEFKKDLDTQSGKIFFEQNDICKLTIGNKKCFNENLRDELCLNLEHVVMSNIFSEDELVLINNFVDGKSELSAHQKLYVTALYVGVVRALTSTEN